MIPDSDLSRVLETIYDQSGSPDEWPAMLAELARFCGGHVGQLYAGNPSTAPGIRIAAAPVAFLPTVRRYIDEYASADTRIPLLNRMIGRIGRGDDVNPRDFAGSDMYRDLYLKNDIHHDLFAIFGGTATGPGAVFIHRSKQAGSFEDVEAARLALVAPHLKRSFELREAIGARSEAFSYLATFIDALDRPVVLLDHAGRAVFANRRGETLLRRGRVHAGTAAEANALERAITEAAAAPAGVKPSGPAVVELRLHEGPIRLLVCPLPRGHRLALLGGTPRAVVAVIGQERPSARPDRMATLASLFGLTPAEARLADRIAADMSLAEAADALGIAMTTARWHLKTLFEKTGTHRQSALVVRLRDCFSLPLP